MKANGLGFQYQVETLQLKLILNSYFFFNVSHICMCYLLLRYWYFNNFLSRALFLKFLPDYESIWSRLSGSGRNLTFDARLEVSSWATTSVVSMFYHFFIPMIVGWWISNLMSSKISVKRASSPTGINLLNLSNVLLGGIWCKIILRLRASSVSYPM